MVDFSINLLRNRVAPPETRKMIFLAMVLYLSLCGMVLVLVAGRGTQDILAGMRHRSDILRLEKDFKEAHPGQSDIQDYAQLLKFNAEALSKNIGDAEQRMAERVDYAGVLLGLIEVLPDNLYPVSFRLIKNTTTFEFDLAAPISATLKTPPNAVELVSVWNKNARLVQQVKNISAVSIRRKLTDGRATFVLTFNGEVRGKAH